MTISFFVPGIPVTQGSMRSFRHAKTGKTITLHDKAGELKGWRQAVAYAYLEKCRTMTDGPCEIRVECVFPRPRGHLNSKGVVKPGRERHCVKPDTCKLLRAIKDALEGVAYTNDSRVDADVIIKRYSIGPDDPCGAWIELITETQ